MSNSQEQSLNEDVVFAPLYESSPAFLHCERERRALECLLREGPGAFRSKLEVERLGAFLSQEEATQIYGWVQDYQCSPTSLGDKREVSGGAHIPSSYCPENSDKPLPSLQLGWPERQIWPKFGETLIYTNPPVPGAPAIREVLRRMIQGAKTLVAVVTDKLTDSAVIGDLIGAASRGVPVYVVLNRRSVQDSFTSPRLLHQNIRVRLLGGKTFCSREGKMVVGELKENFILVDLDVVMVGSYSLTWADAHLHRQLVTVLHGPVVECFDNEFRILYADSTAVPESCWGNDTLVRMEVAVPQPNHAPKPRLPLDGLSEEEEVWPPPPNDPIDWEALGVIQKDQFTDDPFNLPGELQGLSLSPPPLLERWARMEKETPLSLLHAERRAGLQRGVPPAPAYEEQNRRQIFAPETRYSPGSENLHWNTTSREGLLYTPQSWKNIFEMESTRQTVQSNIYRTHMLSVEEPMFLPNKQQSNEENVQAHFHLKKDINCEQRSRPPMIDQGRSPEMEPMFLTNKQRRNEENVQVHFHLKKDINCEQRSRPPMIDQGRSPEMEPMFLTNKQRSNEENVQAHFHLKKDINCEQRSRPPKIDQGRSPEMACQSPKKPLILMVPVPENGSVTDFSDILKGFKTESSSQENPLNNTIKGKGTNMSVQSLGFQSTETDKREQTVPTWRMHDSGLTKPRMTPAQALMQTRNDEVKATPSRIQQIYASPFRVRAFSLDFTRDRKWLQQDGDRQLQPDQEHRVDGGH